MPSLHLLGGGGGKVAMLQRTMQEVRWVGGGGCHEETCRGEM
jgi:hypothetical protein